MPRSRYDDEDDDYDRPRRRRRRDDDDRDPGRPRKGGGLPVGIVVGGAVGLVLLVIGGIVLAVTMRKGPAPEAAKGDDPPAPAEVWPNPVLKPQVRLNPFPDPNAGGPAPEAPKKVVYGTLMPEGTPRPTRVVFGGGAADGVVGLIGLSRVGSDTILTVAKVKTGEAVGRVTIPVTDSPMGYALAPGGKYAAARLSSSGEGDVVILYDVPSGQSYRFRPYPQTAGRLSSSMVGVGFTGPDRLLTVHETSGFDVWQLPKMTRVCGQLGRQPATTPFVQINYSSDRPGNYGVTPDGKTFAVFDGTGFSFFDTTTAERKAKTEQIHSGLSANFWGAAFNGDGTKFACLCSVYNPQSTNGLFVWETATGKRVSATTVAPGKWGTGVAWCGSNQVAIWKGASASADIMSVANGEIVGTVETDLIAGARHIASDTPGDAIYYVYDHDPRARGGVDDRPVLAVVPPNFAAGRRLLLGPSGPQARQ